MTGRSVATGTSSKARRATVCVGETWNEVFDAPLEPASAAVAVVESFSLALPPIALGALCSWFWELIYMPRPIPPAMHYERISRVQKYVHEKLTARSKIPMTQTHRLSRVLPLCVFLSHMLERIREARS